MRGFATALLVAQSVAVQVRLEDGHVDATDDYMLPCLEMAEMDRPDYCNELENVRGDFEIKIDNLRGELVAHTGDTTIHSSTSSVDLPGDSESSSTDHSSSDSH